MSLKKLKALLIAGLMAAVLAACGGGDNPNVDSPAAGDETPGALPADGSGTGTGGTGTGPGGTGTTTP